MKKKDPAAVNFGRRGGLARAASLTAAELSDIGKLGGRPPLYRLKDRGGEAVLERRHGESWKVVPKPYTSNQRLAIRRMKARP